MTRSIVEHRFRLCWSGEGRQRKPNLQPANTAEAGQEEASSSVFAAITGTS